MTKFQFQRTAWVNFRGDMVSVWIWYLLIASDARGNAHISNLLPSHTPSGYANSIQTCYTSLPWYHEIKVTPHWCTVCSEEDMQILSSKDHKHCLALEGQYAHIFSYRFCNILFIYLNEIIYWKFYFSMHWCTSHIYF